jgi:MFS family permease
MRRALGTLGAVARDRTLLRVEVAFLGYNMAEYATWIAILVYAYQRGGASAAGIAALVQLLPAAAIAPLAAFAGDRFRRDRVLQIDYVIQAVAIAITALALTADLAPPLVLGAAAITTSTLTFTRPAQAALMPTLAATPEDLTAANVASGMVEGAGVMLGPLIAGMVLEVSEPASVFAIFAVVSIASAALVSRLPVDERAVTPAAHLDAGTVLRGTWSGFTALRRARDARTVVVVLASAAVVVGALDVLFVATAIDLLALGEGWAGYLNAAFGLGGIVGAGASVALIGRRRLTPPLAGGAGVLGASVGLIAAIPSATSAPLLFAAGGAGRSAADVAGRTLLQRVAPDDVLARVFGVLEGFQMLAFAVGSVAASALAEAFGIRAALAVTGAFVPAVLVVMLPRLLRIDRDAVAPDPAALERLRALDIFAPLPATAFERLVRNLERVDVDAGTIVIAEGDAGDRFFVIAEGEAEVTTSGRHVATLEEGEAFGEIALLRDVPRTATVTARTPMKLLALARGPFLAAVTGYAGSATAADRLASERLAGISREG